MKQYLVYRHIVPNGKVYIGVTCQSAKCRWHRGDGYKNQKHFFDLILQYGWDNIKHEILCSKLNKETAECIEHALIEEAIRNGTAINLTASSKGDWRFGAEKRRGAGNGMARKVVNVETGEIFDCIADASASIGKNRHAVWFVVSGKSKTCGGYHWRYATEEEIQQLKE